MIQISKSELPWINADNSLFDTTTGTPIYLPHLNVQEVKWWDGNPKLGVLGVRAIVTFYEDVRKGTFLFGLENGAAFELLHKECGPRDRYDLEDVAARFSNCEVLSKWVDDLVINDPNLTQMICVFVQVRADFKLLV